MFTIKNYLFYIYYNYSQKLIMIKNLLKKITYSCSFFKPINTHNNYQMQQQTFQSRYYIPKVSV
jgi:hypothetical protein